MRGREETQRRWQESSRDFSERIKEDIFDREKVQCWRDIIYEHVPKSGNLKILDIGTGPGFFAIILSQDDHDVTGIDCTHGMILEAKKNAEAAQVSPSFSEMDCHVLEFADDSFDLIVCRNVTWTLYDPIKAYAEWKRVLKPGGRMLLFDAEWYMNFFDEKVKKQFDEGILTYREKYGDFPEGFSMYLIEDYWLKLPLVGVSRPQWDQATLWKQGFSNIKCICDINDRVYTEERPKLLYGATPMFMISADKPGPKEETLDFINRYWSSVAVKWGVSCLKGHAAPQKAAYQKLLQPYLQKRAAKVLDIGTGSGFLATLLAEAGYKVAGVDLSKEMLVQARYCAKALGVDVQLHEAVADNLPFADQSFDYIVSKNVTWLLQDPPKAFQEWNRVLKRGGRIVYIDANWYLYQYDETERLRFKENLEEAAKTGQTKHYGNGHSSTVLIDNLSRELPFSKVRRPDWDQHNLNRFGFDIVAIRKNITPEICDADEVLRTKATPMFLVCAEKSRAL